MSNVTRKPKILAFDLETAPLKSAIWSAKQRYTPYNMLDKDWYLLSFAAKWVGSNKIIYKDLRNKEAGSEDDYDLINNLHSLLSQADILIAHNGDRFDIPSLNTRFIKKGFLPPSPTQSVDTMRVARQQFRLPYYSLDYLTKTLLEEKYHKRKSTKFPGYSLWSEVLAGNLEAWQEMEDYNKQDVVALEALYIKLLPWIKGHPNVALLSGDAPDTHTCPNCGSTNQIRRGYQPTKFSGVYQRYVCGDCGKWSRSRTTITTKDKRKNILMG